MIHDLVFLFDVDNTLLNNDRVQADLDVHIGIEHGAAGAQSLLGDLREPPQ